MQLGPARFTHISTCAREVCRAFKLKDELQECILTLTNLDAVLEALRSELAQLTSSLLDEAGQGEASLVKMKVSKPPNYSTFHTSSDLKKARRLISARENAIKAVKTSLAKQNQDA